MFAAGDLVAVVVIVLEVEQVPAAAAASIEIAHPIDHPSALPGRNVDQVDVEPATAEHAVEDVLLTVGFGGVLLAAQQRDGLVEIGAEPHETVGVDVPRRQVALLPVAALLQLLHRVQALIEGMPDVDVGGLGCIAPAPWFLFFTRALGGSLLRFVSRSCFRFALGFVFGAFFVDG